MSPSQHRALADAALEGDARAVALLLSLGFDPRVPGHDSGSALHLAAWAGAVEMVEKPDGEGENASPAVQAVLRERASSD